MNTGNAEPTLYMGWTLEPAGPDGWRTATKEGRRRLVGLTTDGLIRQIEIAERIRHQKADR